MSTNAENVKAPRWREDFPIRSGEDTYATRREFTKFLGLTSFAFFAGTAAAAARKWWKKMSAVQVPEMPVASAGEIPVGGYKLFKYPTDDHPCILIRLETAKFAAFDQRCTHLSCPVFYDAAVKQLVCPCHEGFFNAEDGQPIAGPAKRQLAPLVVSVHSDKIWIRLPNEESI